MIIQIFVFILIFVQTLFAHNWLTIPQYTSRAFEGFVGDNFEFFVNLNPILIFILTPIEKQEEITDEMKTKNQASAENQTGKIKMNNATELLNKSIKSIETGKFMRNTRSCEKCNFKCNTKVKWNYSACKIILPSKYHF